VGQPRIAHGLAPHNYPASWAQTSGVERTAVVLAVALKGHDFSRAKKSPKLIERKAADPPGVAASLILRLALHTGITARFPCFRANSKSAWSKVTRRACVASAQASSQQSPTHFEAALPANGSVALRKAASTLRGSG